MSDARTCALLARAAAGIEALEADPHSARGRGLLGEAVAGLGDELPDWAQAARATYLLRQPPDLPVRTERLLLRRLRLDDLDDVLAYRGRADVARLLLHEPYTRAEMEQKLREWLDLGPDDAPLAEQDEHGLVLGVEHEGRIVGDLVLMFEPPAHSSAELGWVLHPDVAGRGLATEAARALLDLAFGHYGFHRVHADLDARNGRSRELCERLGMRQELHGLRDYWSKGEWTDSYRYALLREEYAGREITSTCPGGRDSIEG